MTDEAKRIVDALNCSGSGTKCSNCDMRNICLTGVKTNAANRVAKLSADNDKLFYSLLGVMHFVDKFLDCKDSYCDTQDPDGQIALDRARLMREKVCIQIESLSSELKKTQKVLANTMRANANLAAERNEWKRRAEAAERDIRIAADNDCLVCRYCNTEECKTRQSINSRTCFKWRGPCAENGGISNGKT